MKKTDLVEECKKLGLESDGNVSELKIRIKNTRIKHVESVEDLFKNYELEQSK